MDNNKIPICNELKGTEYEKIINMTNEEAADILQIMLMSTPPIRGDGKSRQRLLTVMALNKGIDSLLKKKGDNQDEHY